MNNQVPFSANPKQITEIANAIEPELCQDIIDETRPRLTPALVGKSIMRIASPTRRAMNYKYRTETDWSLEIRKQVAQLAEVDLSFVEPVEVVCYQQGGYYFRHNDGEDRAATFVACLSDRYVGGELYFDRLGAMYTSIPVGTALFYENTSAMRHECRQVTSGEKWMLIVWVSKYDATERIMIGRDDDTSAVPESSSIIIP